MDEDEDVIIEGSELHSHLISNGFQDFEVKSPTSAQEEDIAAQIAKIDKSSRESSVTRSTTSLEGRNKVTSTVWPDSSNKLLEVELAQEIIKSELLVSEDEDFIHNFILSEDVLDQYKRECEGGNSYLGEVLMFSGSLAAVAGAVFFLSERTRAAAAAAAVLPSAMAAMSSIRIGAKMKSNKETEQFKDLLKSMIQNMKTFKQLLRKSLNLIQGMEMMNQGYLMSMNHHSGGGGNSAGGTTQVEESSLTKALCKRSSFIELRRAIYSCTVQVITMYRESVQYLMELTPLADHIDLKDHYLAFIEMENFGIEKSVPDQRLSIRQLKDTIQLSLLQQSEYLRRFSLSFCERVREDESLNKSGILKHVKEVIAKIRKVTDKLGKVFEYHQALGLLPVPELEQRALTLRKQQSLDMVQKLLPLRNVYTSLFSTGLHLQNSLLRVRHLEGFFDILEKFKSNQDNVSNVLPDEEKLIEWLKGFEDIQAELNACLTCLDEGVGQIHDLTRPSSARSMPSAGSPEVSSADSVADSSSQYTQRVISESDEPSHLDEVFEAFIRCDNDDLKFEDDFVNDQEKTKEDKKQSQKVLKELKSVLKVKEREFQVREAKAIARQARVDSVDFNNGEDNCEDLNARQTNCGADSAVDLSSGHSNSVRDTAKGNKSDGDNSLDLDSGLENSVDTNSKDVNGEEKSNGIREVKTEDTLEKKNPNCSNGSTTHCKGKCAQSKSCPYSPSSKQFLGVEEPMIKSNILGLSQETDSDCESFRSDTGTVRSPQSDAKAGHSDSEDPGHHSDSVSFVHSSRTVQDDSDLTDSSDDISSSKFNGRSPDKPGFSALLPHMSQSTQLASEMEPSRAFEARSFSTPDLKRMIGNEVTSPYVSLEKLLDADKEDVMDGEPEVSTRSWKGDEFSSGSSSDSEEGKDKSRKPFRRPPRPAALKSRTTRQRETKWRANHSSERARDSSSTNEKKSSTQAEDPSKLPDMPRLGREPEQTSQSGQQSINNLGFGRLKSDIGARLQNWLGKESSTDSVYHNKHRNDGIQMNFQPTGFDSRLAAAAVAKSRQMRFSSSTSFSATGEEYFGSSESETEDSK